MTAVLFVASRLRPAAEMTMTGRGLSVMRNGETHDLLLRAASIFEEWPDRFHAFIESKRSCSRRSCRSMLRQQFGEFYENFFWNARLSHPDLDFFRKALADFFGLHGEGYFVRRIKVSLTHLTITKAAERLGVSNEWVKRFISEGKLKTVRHEGLRKWLFVEAASVEKLRTKLGRQLGLTEAAEFLGVSPQTVIRLVSAQRLTPVRGRKIDGSRGLKFDHSALRRFADSVTDDLPRCDTLFEFRPDTGFGVKRVALSHLRRVVKVRAMSAGNVYPEKRLHRKWIASKTETPYLSFWSEC